MTREQARAYPPSSNRTRSFAAHGFPMFFKPTQTRKIGSDAGSDTINGVLAAAVVLARVTHIRPPRDMRYRWEGHGSESALPSEPPASGGRSCCLLLLPKIKHRAC